MLRWRQNFSPFAIFQSVCYLLCVCSSADGHLHCCRLGALMNTVLWAFVYRVYLDEQVLLQSSVHPHLCGFLRFLGKLWGSAGVGVAPSTCLL